MKIDDGKQKRSGNVCSLQRQLEEPQQGETFPASE